MVNGKETFPLVPVAVGLYSTAFNIFNTAIMFPFVTPFANFLARVGHSSADDKEDYSAPRYLEPGGRKDIATGVVAVQKESGRFLEGVTDFLAIARSAPKTSDEVVAHYVALDGLSREIRGYTAEMLQPNMPAHQADMLASLVEEEDWTASLGETLFQIARRAEREKFGPNGQELLNAILDEVATAMRAITPNGADKGPVSASAAERLPAIQALRDRCLKADLPWTERGAILTLLGSAERAFYLIERIDAERRSVARVVPAAVTRPGTAPDGLGSAVPAE